MKDEFEQKIEKAREKLRERNKKKAYKILHMYDDDNHLIGKYLVREDRLDELTITEE